MDEDVVLDGFVPIDNPTSDPETARKRRMLKQSKWRIDMAMDQEQIEPLEDDGKRDPDAIFIPDNRNSV